MMVWHPLRFHCLLLSFLALFFNVQQQSNAYPAGAEFAPSMAIGGIGDMSGINGMGGMNMMSPLQSYGMSMRIGNLSTQQIRMLANHSAQAISGPMLQMLQRGFAEFAPDSWVAAFNNLNLSTIRCLVYEGTIIGLNRQRQLLAQNGTASAQSANEAAAEEDSSYDYYNNGNNGNANQMVLPENGTYGDADARKNRTLAILQQKCQNGFNQVLALNAAINDTMQQIPAHVLQIMQNFGKRYQILAAEMQSGNISAVKQTYVDFLQELKSVTSAERQQIGALFPKLAAVIMDPRIDQLLDLMINATLNTQDYLKTQLALAKLGSDIWKSARVNASSTMATRVAKREVNPNGMAANDVPEAQSQPGVVFSSNNEPLHLVVQQQPQMDDGQQQPQHDGAIAATAVVGPAVLAFGNIVGGAD